MPIGSMTCRHSTRHEWQYQLSILGASPVPIAGPFLYCLLRHGSVQSAVPVPDTSSIFSYLPLTTSLCAVRTYKKHLITISKWSVLLVVH